MDNREKFYARYAPPFAVIRDLEELEKTQGLRKATQDWLERIKELLSPDPLPEGHKQEALIPDTKTWSL